MRCGVESVIAMSPEAVCFTNADSTERHTMQLNGITAHKCLIKDYSTRPSYLFALRGPLIFGNFSGSFNFATQ
jgi:hypothetical protein